MKQTLQAQIELLREAVGLLDSDVDQAARASRRVQTAAQWLADQKEPPKPAVPHLRKTFGLTAHEACEACALAGRYRIVRRAFG